MHQNGLLNTEVGVSDEGVTVTQSFALCYWAERAMGSREHCCGSVLSPARVCGPTGPARVCGPVGPARVCSPVSPESAAPRVLPESAAPWAAARRLPRPSSLDFARTHVHCVGDAIQRNQPLDPPQTSCKEMPRRSVPATSVSWPAPHFLEAGRRAGTGRRLFLGETCEGSPAARARLLRPPRPGCSSKEAGAAGEQVGSELLGFKKARLRFFPD